MRSGSVVRNGARRRHPCDWQHGVLTAAERAAQASEISQIIGRAKGNSLGTVGDGFTEKRRYSRQRGGTISVGSKAARGIETEIQRRVLWAEQSRDVTGHRSLVTSLLIPTSTICHSNRPDRGRSLWLLAPHPPCMRNLRDHLCRRYLDGDETRAVGPFV
jgi:hypothetical protein